MSDEQTGRVPEPQPGSDVPADASTPQQAVVVGAGSEVSVASSGTGPSTEAGRPDDDHRDGDQPAEDEWWQDPSMPWKQKPGRSDIACLIWLGALGVFSMLMMPLRAWLMGSPDRIPLLVALTGSRTGTAMLGAVVRTGDYSVSWSLGGHALAISWLLPMVAAVIMSCKFDWIYWWAGKLWGRGMIEVWAGKSDRARRRYERVERWAGHVGWLAFVLAYVPVPLPLMAVVFVLAGASGMRLRRFIALDVIVCSAWTGVFFVLGYWVGTPITDVLNAYSKIANYVTIALVVVVIGWSIVSSVKKTRAALHEPL